MFPTPLLTIPPQSVGLVLMQVSGHLCPGYFVVRQAFRLCALVLWMRGVLIVVCIFAWRVPSPSRFRGDAVLSRRRVEPARGRVSSSPCMGLVVRLGRDAWPALCDSGVLQSFAQPNGFTGSIVCWHLKQTLPHMRAESSISTGPRSLRGPNISLAFIYLPGRPPA